MAIVTPAASRGEPSRRYETINLYASGAISAIELNRPGRMNAWNAQLGEDLLDAVRTVGGDPAVRAVLITGAGRAFSAGQDLKERLPATDATGGAEEPPPTPLDLELTR